MIYEPQEDSFLLQKWVKKLAKGIVLDVGTGSGIQAVSAAEKKSVKNVVAVDIDKDAIEYCKKNIKNKLINKKIKFLHSDLFKNVKDAFDTIIFNPPYLPRDKTSDETALTGGKHGYEIIQKFLNSVSEHLNPTGFILTVFSSFTNKQKVSQIIAENLLEFQELEKNHIFFEDLFVYKLTKTNLLNELNKKGLKNIQYFSSGKRGKIYIAEFKGKKVAVKIKKEESKAQNTIENEAKMLVLLNKHKICPKFLFKGEKYLTYRFVEGKCLKDWINSTGKSQLSEILIKITNICRKLDKLGINKEEMHHPWKHIIIKNSSVNFIDFERAHFRKQAHNVAQFMQCIMIILNTLKIAYDKQKAISLSRNYQQKMSDKAYQEIIRWIKNACLGFKISKSK